jgi:hypothetical protein
MTFSQFWFALNLALKDRGLAPLLFGEARVLWDAGKETAR